MTALTCALGPDAAGTVLMRLLRDARHSIDAAVYEIGPSYRWALVLAVERGVRVRVVLDAHVSDGNAATSRALIAAGGECRVAGFGADAAHGKLLLVDGAVAIGTGNLLWRDAPRDPHLRLPPQAPPLSGTREWWVVAAGSRRLKRTGADAFAKHWSTATPPPAGWSSAPQLVAPQVGTPIPQLPPAEHCVPSRRMRLITGGHAVGGVLLSMVTGARKRVLVTVPYAHSTAGTVIGLLAAMGDAAARGVECGVLLGGIPVASDAIRLSALPFPVRRMDPDRSTSGHAKGMVADGAVLVASANWSAPGLGGNWEVALRVDHAGAASYYAAAWRRDWDSGLPLEV